MMERKQKKYYIIISLILCLASCNENTEKSTPIHTINEDTKVIVTEDNFVRAKSNVVMQQVIERFSALGRFHHNRWMYDLNNQDNKRANLDTIYSFAIVDLNTPVEITMPETHGKYQSLMAVSQDHSTTVYYTGVHTLTKKDIGSRYAFLLIRTFVDPTDKQSLLTTHQLQNAVLLKQDGVGEFSVPQYDQSSLEKVSENILTTEIKSINLKGYFGHSNDIAPELKQYGAAYGWGGLPERDAIYQQGKVSKPDGETPYSLTVNNVPVDAFWSISVYNEQGFFEINNDAVYSINSSTAVKNSDGSITINFGRTNAINNLDIFNHWHYLIRLYQPQKELLLEQWHFPNPIEVK